MFLGACLHVVGIPISLAGIPIRKNVSLWVPLFSKDGVETSRIYSDQGNLETHRMPLLFFAQAVPFKEKNVVMNVQGGPLQSLQMELLFSQMGL